MRIPFASIKRNRSQGPFPFSYMILVSLTNCHGRRIFVLDRAIFLLVVVVVVVVVVIVVVVIILTIRSKMAVWNLQYD